jgi:hypothetical protein
MAQSALATAKLQRSAQNPQDIRIALAKLIHARCIATRLRRCATVILITLMVATWILSQKRLACLSGKNVLVEPMLWHAAKHFQLANRLIGACQQKKRLATQLSPIIVQFLAQILSTIVQRLITAPMEKW